MLIIMGKSCSGKDTLIRELKNRGWHRIVTYTTRPKREGEQEGVDYHFVTEAKFLDMVAKKQFAEYKSFTTAEGVWYYGIAISDLLQADDHSIICLTPAGVLEIKGHPLLRKVPKHVLYVYASDETILSRLESRGDNAAEAARRFFADKTDFQLITCINYKAVWNDNISISLVADEVEHWYSQEMGGGYSD